MHLLSHREVTGNMPNVGSVTASNRYYLARVEAAKGNDRLSSQEGAAEALGISEKRLKQIERELTIPYPEEIIMMAAEYGAPELLNHFCSGECPIGKQCTPKAECHQLDRMAIRILSSLEGMKGLGEEMIRIAADGKVTPDEVPELRRILEAFHQAAKTAAELQIWMAKYVKEGQTTHG